MGLLDVTAGRRQLTIPTAQRSAINLALKRRPCVQRHLSRHRPAHARRWTASAVDAGRRVSPGNLDIAETGADAMGCRSSALPMQARRRRPSDRAGLPRRCIKAMARVGGIARSLPVECDRPDAAAAAAGPRDCITAVDDARRLQSGVACDPQQALSRFRNPLNASAGTRAARSRKEACEAGPRRKPSLLLRAA
jgi:hypothetical protein